jgi:ribonuclease R
MRKTPQDAFADREAKKYANPISSRELIMEHLTERKVPLTLEQLAEELGHTSDEQLEALRRRLRAMERDGQLIRNRRGGYGLVTKMDLVRGRVIGHPDGFGFLVPDEGGDDLFLSPREMRGLMHGDRAVVRVSGVDRRGRREGALVEVLERNTQRVTGRFSVESGIGIVSPTQKRVVHDILVPLESVGEAKSGQMVVVELLVQPSARLQPIGRVVEVLGEHMGPGMEIDVAIRAFELPHEWSEAVQEEAAQFRDKVPPAAKKGREDLRSLPLVTIDGEDARDFDDAVYCEPLDKGWRLLVAIADVSSYVEPGTALDEEAYKRGNSVYFPERVIPMLPEVLSNGLCSLNPGVDRLCMVCELRFGPRGKVLGFRFFEGLMRSAARLTYTEVAAVLDGDKDLRQRYAKLVPHLENLHTLYRVLQQRRRQRGTIDFETTETRILFGPERKIERIVPLERNDAHKLIEECMIAANVAAAELLLKHKMPTLYRVHEGPNEEKLAGLRDFLGELGLQLGGGDEPKPKDFAKLLLEARKRPEAHLIQTVILRSLKQAVYTPEPKGHFGLAFAHYAHFTSPIRRYPDLLVHRAIRHLLVGQGEDTFGVARAQMEILGEHCSMTDRRADEATWDVINWLKAEYMMDRVGEEFDGMISGVASFGIFVELRDIYVEGMVHVTALSNDYYHFDPVHHRLTGEHTHKVFRLGDPLRVKIARVDLDERRIEFLLAEELAAQGGATGRSSKRRTRRKR